MGGTLGPEWEGGAPCPMAILHRHRAGARAGGRRRRSRGAVEWRGAKRGVGRYGAPSVQKIAAVPQPRFK